MISLLYIYVTCLVAVLKAAPSNSSGYWTPTESLQDDLSEECTGGIFTLTASDFTPGAIIYPFSGVNYNTNLDLCWNISANQDILVSLTSNIGAGDYIKVYDGTSTSGTLVMDKTDKQSNVHTTTTTSDSVFLRFTSDGSLDYEKDVGFILRYVSGTSTACGTTVTAGATLKYISSPNFPSKYPNSTTCTSEISAATGTINVDLIFVSIEKSTRCAYDSLTMIDSDGTELIRYCGTNWTPTANFTSKGTSVTVKFRTDFIAAEYGYIVSYQLTDVDGGWSDWSVNSDWTECGTDCMRSRARTRTCSDPPPLGNGKICEGPGFDTETEPCHICSSVDGGWSDWSDYLDWTECGTDCMKRRTRTRTCSNPPQSGNGKSCQGDSYETTEMGCTHAQCPSVDGGWSDWSDYSDWTECGTDCMRSNTRTRTCSNPPPSRNGKSCQGDRYETVREDCTHGDCPSVDGGWSDWSDYSDWTECGTDCMRSKTRTRTCSNPPPSGNGKSCQGDIYETVREDCTHGGCPSVDGGWSDWSDFPDWTECGTDCMRSRIRTRTCSNPPPSGNGKCCQGDGYERTREICTHGNCPVDGEWSNWSDYSDWTECETNCIRNRTRTRTCIHPPPSANGKNCQGKSSETTTENCYEQACLAEACTKNFHGYAAHPGACDYFLQCIGQPDPRVYVRTCAKGTYWSQTKLACEHIRDSKCVKNEEIEDERRR